MKPRHYCCCAIPTVNAGIYAALLEQFTLGMVVAILALATPNIVGATATPALGPVLLAIICFVVAALQALGFWGVFKEKPSLFRRYTWLHMLGTTAAFAVAAVWVILAATSHNSAASTCETDFFSEFITDDSAIDVASEGQTLCDIFSWVDVGIMGGLWILLAIMQLYLFFVISGYSSSQRFDRDQYYALPYDKDYSGDIPLTVTHEEPWNTRDEEAAGGPGHARNLSGASVSTILAEKPEQPIQYGYSNGGYAPPEDYPKYQMHDEQENAYPEQTQAPYTQSSYKQDGQ